MSSPFEAWLVERGYRRSTVRQSVAQMENVERSVAIGGMPEVYQVPAVRRWLAFSESKDEFPYLAGLLREMGYEAATGGPKRAPSRKVVRRSFSDEQWSKLLGALEVDETREACVLRLIAVTGLRIGDALGIPAPDIAAGLESGDVVQVERKGGTFIEVPVAGSAPEWNALLVQMDTFGYAGDIVASYVRGQRGSSPLAGDAAYQRVNRHLKSVADELGLPGPVHLHRLRRTLAVQALRETGDMTLVQRLLGHRSLQSTSKYVDEIRTHDVGELQRKLGRYRGGKE